MMRVAFSTLVLAIGLFAATVKPAFAQGTTASRQQVELVIEKFKKTMINKDIDGFMKLFLREDITWAAVYTDSSVERYNASLKDPNEPRAPKVQGGSPRKFITSIAKAKEVRSETFSNVRIDTDGEVAHVWFDYTFMVGDYKNNWGKESWQLVRAGSEWKIAAVIWSAEENPTPR
jgi:hypothetical protein